MQKKKKPTTPSKSTSSKSPRSSVVAKRLQQSLLEADLEIDALHWQAAQVILEDLYRRYPDDLEVLSRLLNTSYEIGDTERYQEICEKLLNILPEDVELTLAMAGAYMLNSRPALARSTFMAFLEKWPEHESAAEVRKSQQEIERFLLQTADENHLSLEDAIRLMEMHERMQSLHYQGKNRQAIQLGEKILREFPEYLPALNNLSQLQWLVDKRSAAIQLTLRALEKDPHNLHARADLVIYRLLTGEVEQAKEDARLLQVRPDSPLPHVHKLIEAYSYLGDDQAVLDAYQQAISRSDFRQMGHGSAVINHLAAVAYLRQDNEDQARKCWDQALEVSPNYDNARSNRLDLENPVNLRHTPWAFRISQWLPEHTVRDLLQRFDPSVRSKDQSNLQQEARLFLEKNPAVVSLAGAMLERGDESSREFILVLARYTDNPKFLEKLRDFAFSKRGPDQIRLEAAHLLVNEGVLPSGMTKLWIKGAWMELLLVGIQVKEAIRYKHDEEVSTLLKQAFEQLDAGDGAGAEITLKQALVLEPEMPDALFNLAAAYLLQGKPEDSDALLSKIHHDHPDYLFGRIGFVQSLLEKKEFDQAAQVLKPLYLVREMTASEFDAFCGVNISLHLGVGNTPAARAWFGFWESANPENPKLEVFRWRAGIWDEQIQ